MPGLRILNYFFDSTGAIAGSETQTRSCAIGMVSERDHHLKFYGLLVAVGGILVAAAIKICTK